MAVDAPPAPVSDQPATTVTPAGDAAPAADAARDVAGEMFDLLADKAEGKEAPAPVAPAAPSVEDNPEGEAAGGGTDPEPKGDETPASRLPEGVTPDIWEKAVNALRRDNLDAETIEILAANPERMLRLAAKAAKRQAEVDSKLTRLAEYEKRQTETTTTAAEGTTPAPALNVEELVAPVAAVLGEDVKGPMGEALTGIVRHLSAEVHKAYQPLIDRLAFAESQLTGVLVSGARSSLTEDFPEVATPAGWGRVRQQMAKLAPSGFDSIDDLARAAALQLFGRPPGRAEPDKSGAHKQRSQGQPTASGTRPAVKPLTPEQIADARFDALAEGKGVDGARKVGAFARA